MAWDTERTRALLLEAAIAEFSERGLAGARIDRISERAGVNRERLYSYFGSKQKLFEAVLADRLSSSLTSIEVSGEGAPALGEFAGRHFDACLADASLARLIFWEGLENGTPVDQLARRLRSNSKVQEIREAAPQLTLEQAEDLLLTVVTLCYAWVATPNLSGVVLTDGSNRRRRETIVLAVVALTEALL